MKIRPVKRMSQSQPTVEGAGVRLRRAFGFSKDNETDPFLLLDDFRSDSPSDYEKGFPWHPHRGIETITYVLAGEVAHSDSLGNQGSISAGDVQWMTAGSGIIHQEMPAGDTQGRMYGFQLWANLPAVDKMIDPCYRDVISKKIPEVTLENGTIIRVICGEAEGVSGAVQDVIIEPVYLDVNVPAQTKFLFEIPSTHTVISYVFEGRAFFGDESAQGAENQTLILWGDGDTVQVNTTDQPVRFLLIAGKPLHEPVAWYGPVVMNTQAELQIAFQELQNGTFIKKGKG
ncbi:MAG: hypothetical protein CVU39_16315 [Chloroflexi bacterium HGW-Chloroflexi-10]|nr:MAG: hypothetical protein CVU39_16315 [Chloroflexi bacterium HGW-Chloroflexi-10]